MFAREISQGIFIDIYTKMRFDIIRVMNTNKPDKSIGGQQSFS